ncbi:MAG: hypothetical protein NPIRA06_33240 [Nitrospirales bacterium]|nr:MAG: hypothetical protein NPIRA06_33240 [Nitrospirales bacterium]
MLSWFASATADHPLGITTPSEHSTALVMEAVEPTITKSHAYFLNTEHSPIMGWKWMLVIKVFVRARSFPTFGGGNSAQAFLLG